MTQRSIRFATPGLALAALAFAALGTAHAQSTVTLTHVHGLAYSVDGKRLMVPSHHGLAVYADGKWSKAPGPQHDYMGFAATKAHVYSSGHPVPGSGLRNPFGLIRSKDGGGSWDRLSLEGESDFHLLAAGWNSNAVYVWNPGPNSRMRQTGLHYTLNDGFQWQHPAAAGLSGKPSALAVHPDDAKTVAAATSTGIYVSRDSGASFRPLAQGEQGFSVLFDLDGKHLWYGTYAGTPRLARVELQTGKTGAVTLPPLSRDAVTYIAQNPVNAREYAIATFERSVYISKDTGKTWRQIADRGKGK
ncbi:MAG: glycosyl hydrolase [Betaproteobacteria bacterium]|nr:glycosyl hydrolase [Betaproteobacteria bacterium]